MVVVERNIDFSKSTTKLTRDTLLSKFNEEDIFRYYLGPKFKIGGAIKSPLRGDDDAPSFSVYRCRDGRLRFKDYKFLHLRGDCIALVCFLHKVSFQEALKIINHDLSYTKSNNEEVVTKVEVTGFAKSLITPEVVPLQFFTVIKVEQQPYTFADVNYWAYLGVSVEQLIRFDIISCNKVVFGVNEAESVIHSSTVQPIFAYRDVQPEGTRFMIYRPMAEKQNKFRQNLLNTHVFGLKQLAKTGVRLIITKSMKDVAVFDSLGYHVVAARSESELIKPVIIEQLKHRFDDIVTCFDPDPTGRNLAKSYEVNHGFKSFYFPENYKDAAGMVFQRGKQPTQYYIEEQLGKITDHI
jgi:hypothetical protein